MIATYDLYFVVLWVVTIVIVLYIALSLAIRANAIADNKHIQIWLYFSLYYIGCFLSIYLSPLPTSWQYYTSSTLGLSVAFWTGIKLAKSQLTTSLDTLPGIIFTRNHDAAWSMRYQSKACADLTGYHAQELVGKTGIYNNIIHPEDLPQIIRAITDAVNKQQSYEVEYRISTKSGAQKWLRELGNVVFASDGSVSIHGLIIDNTHSARSQVTLQNSEQLYRELFENYPYPMWMYDLETLAFLAVNNAAIRHYEYSRDEFLSMTLQDIRPSEDVADFIEYMSQLSAGANNAGIWRHRKKDGSIIYVEVTYYTLTFAGKRAVVSSIHDITQRQQTEEALRQAEAKYRSIFENTLEGIFQTTPEGQYISANPALARIYGYDSPEELIANIVNIEQQIYVQPNRRSEFIWMLEKQDAISGFESQVYRRDGSVIWVSENVRAVRDASNALVCYEGTVEDITERKYIEAAQARFTTILEATTDLVGICDRHGNQLYLNKAGRRMLGLSDDEDIFFKKILDFHPEWATERILNSALPAVMAGNVWEGETAIWNYNGEEIPVSQVILAHKTPQNEVEFIATIMRDISDRKRFEAQLAYFANHDALTGLFNRRHFRAQLEHHLALTQRHNQCGALIFIDLDDFKDINDTLGHQTGDELLKNFAALLTQQVRKTDILARLGGDEFAIILPETFASQVYLIVQRIIAALERYLLNTNEHSVRISASIGVALFPEHGMTADELLAHADIAMYKSKEIGRNRFTVYTPTSDWRVEVESRNVWKSRICEALEEDRFVLYCQPILDIRNNTCTSYELLLRMLGKQGELISPNIFLPLAESSGLICHIDRWVVRQAIGLIAAYTEVGKDMRLEVNISGKSLSDNQLLPIIQQELAITGIDPASLVLEITETAAIADINQACKFIYTLKQIGCQFALDDFGIGYSSFSQLKHLPVDYLKIDGSFIRNLSHNLVDRHLVKAIVEVAHGLSKSTIAEFVTDAQTLQILRQLGVDYAQGYYIGQPQAVSKLLVGAIKSDVIEYSPHQTNGKQNQISLSA